MPIFEYVGGGYFRVKSLRGVESPIVHGYEIMHVIMAYLTFGGQQ